MTSSALRVGGGRLRALVGSACFAGLALGPMGAGAEEAAPECPRFASLATGLPDRFEWRTHPSLGDVDGDGDLDIAVHPRKGRSPAVFLNDGKGNFTEKSTGLLIPGGTCGVGTDLGDLNGDGHLDLLVADHCRGVHAFLGNGKSVWRLIDGPAALSGRVGVDDAQFGDVNGDGALDIVAIGGFRGGFRVLLGDGKGRFSAGKDNGLPTQGYGPDVKLVDLNADGRLDVIAPFTAEGRGAFTDGVQEGRKLPVVWMNGEEGFFDSSYGIPDTGNFRGVASGDVNGDGHVDLAISGGRWKDRPPAFIMLSDGKGRWKQAAEHPMPLDAPVTEAVELADLNGDGHLDLIATVHLEAGMGVWMGRGDGRFVACPDTGLPAGRTEIRSWGIAVGQVAGDARPDIVIGVGRASKGAVEVWGQVDEAAQ